MGAGNSKLATEPTQHIFSASSPTRFSPSLVDSLENSAQSDTTRSATLELKIQSRVTAELEKLASEEFAKLGSVTELTSSDAPEAQPAPTFLEAVTGDADEQRRAQLSSDSVSKEIAGLRKKLAERKKLEQMDPEVEKAKNELVQCLRINDRKPLDCWQEREAFKREVGRLERRFVERTVR